MLSTDSFVRTGEMDAPMEGRVITEALAAAVVLVHLLYILFAALGGFLVWRYLPLAWLHIPAVAWGAYVELTGGVCPLTPLEMSFRRRAGLELYSGDFIGHTILPLIYVEALTRTTQVALGVGLVVGNLAIYGFLLRRHRPKRAATHSTCGDPPL